MAVGSKERACLGFRYIERLSLWKWLWCELQMHHEKPGPPPPSRPHSHQGAATSLVFVGSWCSLRASSLGLRPCAATQDSAWFHVLLSPSWNPHYFFSKGPCIITLWKLGSEIMHPVLTALLDSPLWLGNVCVWRVLMMLSIRAWTEKERPWFSPCNSLSHQKRILQAALFPLCLPMKSV